MEDENFFWVQKCINMMIHRTFTQDGDPDFLSRENAQKLVNEIEAKIKSDSGAFNEEPDYYAVRIKELKYLLEPE